MRPIGVNTWVWTSPLGDSSLEEIAQRVADWGFDVLELPVENPGDWDPGSARGLLDDLGLAASVVLVMPPGRELVDADRGTVLATQDYLRHCLDVAAQMGSSTLCGPAYSSVGRTWPMTEAERLAAYDELRANLAPVVEHARRSGIKLAVEPLNRYETSLLNTVAQTLEAIDGLPEDGIGLALDVYHQNIEETDIPAAIRVAGPRVAHVQVCANDRGTPGRDHLDWLGILASLDDAGYSGPLCIESFTAHNKSIARAASVWRPLAESQDSLAVDGLEFLRSIQD